MQTSPLVTRIGDPLETAHNVKYAILHPFWDPEKIGSDMGSDIAVLILSEPFPAMPFPSLANFGTAVERNLSGVVGSGANEMADVHQLKLKCQQEFSEDGNITSGDLVCFTRQTGSKDRPCQGDSGAPLIKPSSLMIPDHDLLLGILSSGHVCGGFEKSGDVFTEISKYTLWIRHVQKHPEKCSYSETNFSVEDFSVEISGPFGPGIPFKKKSTALHVVAAFGTTDTANAMVNLFPTGLKFSAENEAGETPLHHAAAVGNFKMVVWLLEENVDINARSYGADRPWSESGDE
ncbi:hypothetical protein BSKO_12252 [Bryopsis sp. KO-2023]|nr:hypothetical protein BSKO_12252 [Bryopsis sp. KO-2023]